MSGSFLLEDMLESCIDLTAVENVVMEMNDIASFSFKEIVMQLINGELPFVFHEIPFYICEHIGKELYDQKETVLQIFMIVLLSAATGNLLRGFEYIQIAEISFYVVYMLIAVLLMRSFILLQNVVSRACENMIDFMEVLLPSYTAVIVFGSGRLSGVGFYEIMVIAIHWVQILILKWILPSVNLYFVVLLLSHMTRENLFSKMADLIQKIMKWILKTLFGLVAGVQAIQCIVAPEIDKLKNTAFHKVTENIPGMGKLFDSAFETVTGAALVVKNGVGIAGIIILLLICMIPVFKIAACGLLFRSLNALIQPICEKRIIEAIDSIADTAFLLLQILTVSVSVFLVSLAMITAFVRG